MADRSAIQEIKESLDIADVVQEYVSLKRSGNNYFGLCPFHHEKTPSFSVNSDIGMFKCFGCGESGDVITFLQKIEGLDFPEALKLAAEKAGIELKNDYSKKDDITEKKKSKIIEINTLTSKFYHFVLKKHKAGKKASAYLNKRKLGKNSIEEFYLGYAPNQWTSLRDFLLSKGYKKQDLLDAGLLVERNGNSYDKFRGRIIFPLFNEKGQIVGFSGRIIEKDTKAPKYLNSPETLVFNKSRFLFGLYQGKKEIREKDFCILVEGPTDVINSNQCGVTNIVAPQGTSLTPAQLKLLHRYCTTLYLCFDQDDAGQTALRRALKLAWDEDFKVKIINLEGVKDADELMQKSPKKWKQSVEDAKNVVDYFLLKLLNKYNAKTIEGKVNIVEEIAPFIANIKNNIEREASLKELSMNLDLDLQVLKKQITKSPAISTSSKTRLREAIKVEVEKTSMSDREEYLLSLIIQSDSLTYQKVRSLDANIFSTEIMKELWDVVKSIKRSKKSVESYSEKIDEDNLKERLINITMRHLGGNLNDSAWINSEYEFVYNLLYRAMLKRDLNRLQIELTVAEKAGNDKLTNKISNKILEQTKKLNSVK